MHNNKRTTLLPSDRVARHMLEIVAENGVSMANLELVGLDVKVLNILERIGIIYFRDLLALIKEGETFAELRDDQYENLRNCLELVPRIGPLIRKRDRMERPLSDYRHVRRDVGNGICVPYIR